LRVAMWLPDDPLASSSSCDAQLQHGRILSAIRERDPDAAEAAVAEHIESTRQDMCDLAAVRGVGPRAHAAAG
jgi:DNA-binding FadR family transcriptional regulator